MKQGIPLNLPIVSLTISELTSINPKLMQAITEIWRVGTVLEATVSQQNHKSISLKLEQGMVKLPLNPEQTYLKLLPDQKVWLNVEQLLPQLRLAISQTPPASIFGSKSSPTMAKAEMPVLTPSSAPTANEAANKKSTPNTITLAQPATAPAHATPPTPLSNLKQQLHLALQPATSTPESFSAEMLASKNIRQEPPSLGNANRVMANKPEWQEITRPLAKLTPLPSELVKVSSTLANYRANLTSSSAHTWLARTMREWPARYLAMRQQITQFQEPRADDANADLTETAAIKTPNQDQLNQSLRQLNQALPNARNLRQADFAESLLKHILIGSPQSSGVNLGTTSSSPPATLSNALAQLLGLLTPLMANPSALSTDLALITPSPLKPELAKTSSPQTSKQTGVEGSTFESSESQEWLKTLADEVARLLGRQQTNWLNNARTDSQTLGLYAELPLMFKGTLNTVEILIREDQENQREQAGQTNYVIRLRFELGPLGPVQFLLSLKEDEIAIQFYAQQSIALALFNDFSDLLTQDLESEGIRVAMTSAHQLPEIPSIKPAYAEGFHERV